MTLIILEQNGRAIDVSGPDALAKALNWGAGLRKSIVMTDECGEVIGAGTSIAAVNRSQPLIKSIKDGELKYRQPMRKSFGISSASLGRLQKSMHDLSILARQHGIV